MAAKKIKPPQATRIIVEVRGGTVQAVYSDRHVHVDVMDWDDSAASEGCARRCSKLDEEINRGLEQVY